LGCPGWDLGPRVGGRWEGILGIWVFFNSLSFLGHGGIYTYRSISGLDGVNQYHWETRAKKADYRSYLLLSNFVGFLFLFDIPLLLPCHVGCYVIGEGLSLSHSCFVLVTPLHRLSL